MSFLVNVVLYLYFIHLVNSLCKLLFYTLKVGMLLLTDAIHSLVYLAKFIDNEACKLVGFSIIILFVFPIAILD